MHLLIAFAAIVIYAHSASFRRFIHRAMLATIGLFLILATASNFHLIP